jgi:hypothetical protein
MASWQELVGADLECSVRAARDRYLADNGFNLESYAAKTFTVQLFGLRLVLPNTRSRRRAIPLHDLHHLATGYGTDLVGEAEIGAWELRCGCNSLVTYYLNGTAALIGLVLAPRRVLRAFRRARGQRTLYSAPVEYDGLLGLSVAELRAHLGLQPCARVDRT